MVPTSVEKDIQEKAAGFHWNQLACWLLPLLIGGLMVLMLSQLFVTRGTYFAADLNQQAFWLFIVATSISGLLLFWLWRMMVSASSRCYWREIYLILLIAMLLRIVGVWASTPQLSDDIWRYLYDGKVLAAGENPYLESPSDRGPLADACLKERDECTAFKQINNPSLVTIYPPVSQYGFAAIMSMYLAGNQALDGDIAGVAGERLFRFYLILLELLLMVLIAVGLRRMNASPCWLWLYAVHPLVLTEIMATGHQDIQGMVLWMAALLLWPIDQKEGVKSRSMVFSGLLWGASLLVKPITIPVAIYLCLRHRKEWRTVLFFIGSGMISCVLLLTPFHFMPGGLSGLIETGRTFSMNWQFNGPLNAFLVKTVGSVSGVHLVMSLLVVCAGVCFGLIKNLKERFNHWDVAAITIMLSLLVSSTVHPWYLLWAILFLPLSRLWSLHLFGMLIVLGYTAIMHPEYKMPYLLSILTHLLVWGALILEVCRRQIRPLNVTLGKTLAS